MQQLFIHLVTSGTMVYHKAYTLLSKQLHPKIFIALSHWSGSRPLMHCHRGTLPETTLGHAAAAQNHRDPVASWLFGTYVTTVCSLDPGHPCGL